MIALMAADRLIPTFTIDVSDQSGELWDALAKWLATQDQGPWELLGCGAGAIAWLQNGRVVHQVIAPFNHIAMDLLEAGWQAMRLDE